MLRQRSSWYNMHTSRRYVDLSFCAYSDYMLRVAGLCNLTKYFTYVFIVSGLGKVKEGETKYFTYYLFTVAGLGEEKEGKER